MPPGTGDIHLSICEKYHVDGVIMVTTPSTLSYADVSRAEDMYKKLGLRILGKICNMAYLEVDRKKKYIFGESSSKNEYQLPLLEDVSSHNQLIKLLDDFINRYIIY
jgi:ATP-binding protein involved in chromosome partitioning